MRSAIHSLQSTLPSTMSHACWETSVLIASTVALFLQRGLQKTAASPSDATQNMHDSSNWNPHLNICAVFKPTSFFLFFFFYWVWMSQQIYRTCPGVTCPMLHELKLQPDCTVSEINQSINQNNQGLHTDDAVDQCGFYFLNTSCHRSADDKAPHHDRWMGCTVSLRIEYE